MRRILATFCMASVLLLPVACARKGDNPRPQTSPEFGRATAIIETEEGPVLLQVEVADKPELRAVGLMERDELPEDFGMVFLYFEDTRSSFYMKNTLLPLSIAFFDIEGKILQIIDMDPCTKDPCELYTPKRSYRGALEVPQGSFGTWGVHTGDQIRIVQ